MNFGNWDDSVHESEDQVKRFANSKKSDTTPLSVDLENKCATFEGSGKVPYAVTLNSCTCRDFIMRKLPCKHIYRLALECHLIEDQYQSGINKNEAQKVINNTALTLADAVANIETLSIESQESFKDFLYFYIYRDKGPVSLKCDGRYDSLIKCGIAVPVVNYQSLLSAYNRSELFLRLSDIGVTDVKKNISYKKLVEWCLTTIPDKIPDICHDGYTLDLPLPYVTSKQKMYSYLHRKFDNDVYYDENLEPVYFPAGATPYYELQVGIDKSTFTSLVSQSSEYRFPDDEVTRLLDKYNCNRCKK